MHWHSEFEFILAKKGLDIQSLTGKIMAILNRHKTDYVTIEKAGITSISQARLKRMTVYIEQHYPEKITAPVTGY